MSWSPLFNNPHARAKSRDYGAGLHVLKSNSHGRGPAASRALHALFLVEGRSLRLRELLLLFRCELAPVDGKRELVEPAGEAERHLVVAVVHRCTGVRADVEVLVPLHD